MILFKLYISFCFLMHMNSLQILHYTVSVQLSNMLFKVGLR